MWCATARSSSPSTRRTTVPSVVPGSHRFGRQPTAGEAVGDAVPVECPAGSLILWHGSTWHGAFPRKNPGLRLNLVAYCNRWYKPQEAYRGNVPAEMLARRSPRFGRLVGADDAMGWKADGPPRSSPTFGVGSARLIRRRFRDRTHGRSPIWHVSSRCLRLRDAVRAGPVLGGRAGRVRHPALRRRGDRPPRLARLHAGDRSGRHPRRTPP